MNPLTPAGRGLLDRRHFLGKTVSGLGAMAFLDLLNRDQLLGAPLPLRPAIDPARPYAPRKPHFAPKAKRVVMVYCSGALSHVDTFDYKPALYKYHDQPMPGGGSLVTFQGEQGNLIKPLREFRPRGQSGKMTSDLLPHLGDCADDFCFFLDNAALATDQFTAAVKCPNNFISEGSTAGNTASY